METYPIDESLQELPELSAVDAEDLLLVSEKEEIDGDIRYFSKKLRYDTLSSGLYAQFDMSELTAAIYRNSTNIAILSADVSRLSVDLYQLSNAFLSNDALTRLIPAISSRVMEISNFLSDMQPIDRIVDLGEGIGRGGGAGIRIFQLSNYSVNVCRAMSPMARFNVPNQDYNGRPDLSDGLSNITRHLVIDVSTAVDMQPYFTNNCKYISDFELTSTLSAGEHAIFTMKEVEKDLMYVTRRSVSCVYSGIGENDLIVLLVYYAAKSDMQVWDPFMASADTRISDYPSYCYKLEDVTPPSKHFSHWVDTAYPKSHIAFQDYPGYYISADLVLSAVYSDSSPIQVYFYGCIPEVATSSYGPLVEDCSPQYFGTNMSASVPNGHNIDVVAPGVHMPETSEFIAWAKDSPYGPAYVISYPPHWELDEPELDTGEARLKFYVIDKPEREYELSDELGVNNGIESIEPDEPDDNTVLELDYNFSLDTDWDDGMNYRGSTLTELRDGSTATPSNDYYDKGNSPAENDVVTVIAYDQDYVWSDGEWRLYDRKYLWSSDDGSEDDETRHVVLLRLDRLYGDDSDEDSGDSDDPYPVSADLMNTDTFLYHQVIYDEDSGPDEGEEDEL